MFTSTLYRASPVFIQEALISARAWTRRTLREGPAFRRLSAEVRETQWQHGSGLAAYQDQWLQRVLLHSATTVPFYRDQVDAREVAALPPREALELFPVIDKEIVRAAGRRMMSLSTTKPLVWGATSGTTGSPLRIAQDLAAVNREHAFVQRQLEWAGLRPGHRRAWIRGDLIVDGRVERPPYWRLNRAEAMLMMSSFHLSVASAPLYIAALEGHNPHVIQAYPSSVAFLAACLKSAGKRFRGRSLRGIVTSSESLDPAARADIERVFGCPVFDWYGQFERVAAVGTCEYGRYHLMTDYSHVELAPPADGSHEVIGTGFNNLAMPLIRYRTGDTVELSEAKSCECGRHFPIVERVHGRADDCVKLPCGRMAGHLYRIFNGANGVVEGQIVQDRVGAVDVLVVPAPCYSAADERSLVDALRVRLGDEVRINVRRVPALTRTRNGKVRNVICTI